MMVFPVRVSDTWQGRFTRGFAQAARTAALPRENGSESREIGLAVGAHKSVGVFRPVVRLLLCVEKAQLELVLGLGPARAQPFDKLGSLGQQNENIDESLADCGVRDAADVGRSLDIEVEENVASGFEMAEDFTLQCAVEIPVDLGVLNKLAARDTTLENIPGEEKVIDTVHLALARRPCRRRDSVGGRGVSLGEAAAKRRFTRTRGA